MMINQGVKSKDFWMFFVSW